MQDVNPRGFLTEQGWSYKEQGDQLVTGCPFCGKPSHLRMNSFNGLWDCKKCGEHGNIPQLRGRTEIGTIQPAVAPAQTETPPVENEVVDRMHKALLEDKAGMDYLTEGRAYQSSAIEKMKLGLKSQGGSNWISFPWFVDGKCRGMKYRAIGDAKNGSRFLRLKGHKSVLYNNDVITDGGKVILASGEPDAVALISMGYTNVVATTTGEAAMPEDCLRQLKTQKQVAILYDNDEAGIKSAEKLAKRIGTNIACIVKLPDGVKDANDYLRAHRIDPKPGMDKILKEAISRPIPTIEPVIEIIHKMREFYARTKESRATDETPWENVNRLIATLSGLVVVSAPQGTGKTTICLNIAEHWARELRRPSLFYCLEMRREELVAKILSAKYDKTVEEIQESWDENFWGLAYQEYDQCQLYIGSSHTLRSSEEYLALLKVAIERFELELLVFDNIHLVGRGRDQRHEIGMFSAGMKALSTEYGIVIMAIAQPRKLEPGAIMTPWDIKDSSDIYSDADQMIILHRQQLGADKDTTEIDDTLPVMNPVTMVRLAKSRFAQTRDELLYCEGDLHKFRELRDGEETQFRDKRGEIKTTIRNAFGPNAEPF